MRLPSTLAKAATAVLVGIFVLALNFASFAASEFEGVWKLKDAKGRFFEITLAPDGSATGTLPPAASGKWKEDAGGVLVNWTSGWTTQISKEGDAYKANSWAGKPSSKPPTLSSAAQKK